MKHSNRTPWTKALQVGHTHHDETASAVPPLEDGMPPAPRRSIGCCVVLLVFLGVCIALGYYVFAQVKDPLVEKWNENLDTIEQAPAMVDQIQKDIVQEVQQGKEVISEVNEQKQRLESAADTVQSVVDTIKKVTQ